MIALVWALAACTLVEPGGGGPVGRPDDDDDAIRGDDEPDCTPIAAIRINEVCPANEASLLDTDGDSSDWFELVNADAAPVDLAGWALSDDKDEPRKWVMPSLVLDPGEIVVVFASDKDRARVVGGWDTRLAPGDPWRYLAVVGPTDPGWFLPGYDDSAWPVGPSGFGSEDGDDATVLYVDTVHVRATIDLTADEVADLAGAYLHVDYDDAFVAYVNGVEVARDGIGVVGTPPAWDEVGGVPHEAAMYTGGAPAAFALEVPGPWVEGANTIAIEVHQATVESTDLTLIPFVTLGFGSDRGGALAPELDLPETELHTNFTLKASGERLRIYDPTGCEADDADPVPLLADESYGRQPDGTGELGVFLEPTPGLPNTTEWRRGFAPTPIFDPPPGHYVGGTSVTVDAGVATVRFATDGHEPTEQDDVYVAPLDVSADREATVLQARAYQDGLWPSRIATGTWFSIAPREHVMVSLVTDPANLWDPDTGIYVFGPDDYDPEPPFYGANFWEDWERPVHVSGWEPDGTLAFGVDAGISIHGHYTRSFEQKSLLVTLDSRYDTGDIEHEVFPGHGVVTYDRLLLRSAGNDWLGCTSIECFSGAHLRDPLMHRIAADANLDVLATRPAEVWLNGAYWGLYWLNEKADAAWVAVHHGVEDIDLLEISGSPNEGDRVAWDALMAFLRTHDLAEPANWAYVESQIDIDELATYLAFEVYYGNLDWPGNNIKWWRPRAPGGRWRWMLYDTDFGLGKFGESPANDSLAAALAPDGVGWPNPPWSTELFRLLIAAPAFHDRFVGIYADHMNTSLAPARMQDLLHELEAEIAPAIPRQLDRWGAWTDGVTTHVMREHAWEDAVLEIEEWMTLRPIHARGHVVSNLGLAGTWDLSLDVDPPGAGTFTLTAVEVDAPFDGTYFQGVPVTITAVPAPGYTFVGWSDPMLPATATITIDRDQATALVAWFE